MKLAVGRIFIRSSITRNADRISFCTLYFGSHALNCGVRSYLGEDAYQVMKQEVITAFNESDFAGIIRLMDTHFGMHTYSLKDLFRDEQRHILRLIVTGTLQDFEDKFAAMYDNSRSLMGFLRDTGMPVPHRFMTTAGTALNLRLRKIFTSDTIDTAGLSDVVTEIRDWQVAVDNVSLEFVIRKKLERAMAVLRDDPENGLQISELLVLLESVALLPVEVNFWETQNIYWSLLQSRADELRAGDRTTGGMSSWSHAIIQLGHLLYFNVAAALAAKEVI